MGGNAKNENKGLQIYDFKGIINMGANPYLSLKAAYPVSKKPIHFFKLGGVVTGLCLAITVKNKEAISQYYSQLKDQFKPIKMSCPSIDKIEKDLKILLNPLEDMFCESEVTPTDFYRIGKIITNMLNYNSTFYKDGCVELLEIADSVHKEGYVELLEIADRYDIRREFIDWIKNIRSNDAQKNWNKMESIVTTFVARRECGFVSVRCIISDDSSSFSAPLSSSFSSSSSSSSSSSISSSSSSNRSSSKSTFSPE